MPAGSAEAVAAAFALFLHDLRGSLAAATGCLRMAHTAEAALMITNAADALRAISSLTQHASTWLDVLDDGPARDWVPAEVVVRAVAHALAAPTSCCTVPDPALGLALSSVEGVAAAVATIVQHTAGGSCSADTLTIAPEGTDLVVAYGTSSDRASLGPRAMAPSQDEPSRFPLFAAQQVIAAHGGATWTLPAPRRAVAVALPLERA